MTKVKSKRQFHKNDQIKLKIKRLCFVVGSTESVLIQPEYLLTYVKGSSNQCHFKVSFNKAIGDTATAKNGQIIRIRRSCFDALGFLRLKNI